MSLDCGCGFSLTAAADSVCMLGNPKLMYWRRQRKQYHFISEAFVLAFHAVVRAALKAVKWQMSPAGCLQGRYAPKFRRTKKAYLIVTVLIARVHPVHLMNAVYLQHREAADIYTVWVKKYPLTFSDIFPKQLGIFRPNFTYLLNVPMYVRFQVFIRLSAILTKLCHIKCDHPACVSTDNGHFEHIMVVALNMA